MNVKKIVVDKLPENCSECIISCESMYSTKYYCHALHNFFERWEKPKECPLKLEEECVWSGNHGGEDENGDALFITKKTSCSDVHIQTVNIPDYKYCPNCGKRIRYAESEER